MIYVTLKDGTRWGLEGFDRVRVAKPGHGEADFRVSDIRTVEVDPLNGGELAIVDGRHNATQQEVRTLQAIDPETGIPVVVFMQLDIARQIGDELAKGKIVLARTMPPLAT